MTTEAERLRAWAQNEEMINQYYTEHGQDCLLAARRIEELEKSNRYLRSLADKLISLLASACPTCQRLVQDQLKKEETCDPR